MKQVLSYMFLFCALCVTSVATAQILNQSAAWPNTNWTLSGTFDAGALLNDPTASSNFSYDDDAAGSGSTDILIAESPVIDLTAAIAGGESRIFIEFDYDYNLGSIFELEYFDADAASWVQVSAIADNSGTTSGWCAALDAVNETFPFIDASAFTATQQSGFQYRLRYDASTVFGWGFCVASPLITSVAPPTCPEVFNLDASVTSATSADITWDASASATSGYDIYFGAAPLTAPDAATVPNVDNNIGNSYSATVATGVATEFYVRNDCDTDGQGVWAGPISVTAIAGAECSFAIDLSAETSPFSGSTTGASASFSPACGGNTSSDLYFFIDILPNEIFTIQQTANSYDSRQFLFFSTPTCPVDETNQISCIDDPEFNTFTWENLTGATQRVYYVQDGFSSFGNSNGTFTLAYSVTPAPSCPNPNTLQADVVNSNDASISWIEAASATEYDLYYGEAPLAAADGTTVPTEANVTGTTSSLTGLTADTDHEFYVRADCAANDSSEWVGPLTFRTLETCPAPTGLAVSAITADGATFDYTENGTATLYDLYYGATPLTAPDGTTVPTENDVTGITQVLTGLADNTAHQFYVRASCAPGDTSSWVGPVGFTTLCGIQALPYQIDFTAVAPDCWEEAGTGDGIAGPGPVGFADWTTSTALGVPTARLNLFSNTDDEWLVGPQFDLSAGGSAVVFDLAITSFFGTAAQDMGPDDSLNVYITEDDVTYTLLRSFTVADGLSNELTEFIIPTNSTSASARILIYGTDGTVNDPEDFDVHIADFKVTNCLDVSGVTISNLNDDGATVSWDLSALDPNETYSLVYGPNLEFNLGPLAPGVTTTDLSGLFPGETIFVDITSGCGGESETIAFNTLVCDSTAQCEYTLTLADTNGDGWNNGGSITVTNGNQAPVTYSVPAGTCTSPCLEIITFKACPDANINVTYNSGTTDGQNYWILDGPNGFSFVQAPAAASSNDFGACPQCAPPSGVVLSDICEAGVTLDWNNAVVYDSVFVELSFGGFFGNTVTTDTLVGNVETFTTTTGAWGTGVDVTYSITGVCQSNGDQGTVSGLFTSPACACIEQCTYEVTLFDTFGDAWSPLNVVEVFADGLLIETLQFAVGGDNPCTGNFMVGGCSQTFTIETCPGANLEFIYSDNCTASCFIAEQSWEVVAPYSAPAAAFTATGGVDGTSFSEVSCPTCPTPVGVAATITSFDSADISFESFNAGDTYTVLYNTEDNFGAATVGVTGTSVAGLNTVSQTGLMESTQYFFWVEEDCGGETSAMSDFAGGTTPAACPVPTGLSCTTLSSEDMSVSFTAGGAGNTYTIIQNTVQDSIVGAVSAATGTTVAGTNSVSIGGLTPQTEYFFWAVEDCGVNGISDTTAVTSCQTDCASACNWTLEMIDTFGDGWNGGFLTVDVDGVTTQYSNTSAAAANESQFANVSVCDGATVTVSWTGGGFLGEVQFNITQADGTESNFGTAPADGIVVGPVLNTCPSCPTSGLSLDATDGLDADVSWSSSNSGDSYVLAYGPTPFTAGDVTEEGRLTGTSAALNALSVTLAQFDTEYAICLFEDCGVNGSTDTTCVTLTTPAANDEPAGALTIACGDLVVGSTSNALPSVQTGFTGTAQTANDLFYTFDGQNSDDLAALTGTPGDQVTLSTCNDGGTTPGFASYDTKIDVYSSAGGVLTFIGGNDDGGGCGGFSSLYSFPTTVGETYIVRVYGFATPFFAGSTGDFSMSVECAPPCLPVPANVDCATPEVVALAPFGTAPNISGTTECAPSLAGGFGCGSTFATWNGVFYEFTTDASGEVYFELTSGTIPAGSMGFVLYDAGSSPCDATTTPLSCGTTFTNIVPSRFELVGNTTYKLAVFTEAGDEGSFDLVVTGPPPPPVNDECAGAIEVPVESMTSTAPTAGTFFGATESTTPDTNIECGQVTSHDDVWMKFEVPASGRVEVEFTSTFVATGTPRWSLYRSATDDCGAMTFITGSCTETNPRLLPAIGTDFGATYVPGEMIYVRLWQPAGGQFGGFEMSVVDPVPANDQCANATAVTPHEFQGLAEFVFANTDNAFGSVGCAGTADETVYFSFVAESANDMILVGNRAAFTPGFPTGFDAVVEVFDGCDGTSLGCYNNYGPDALERVVVGGLTPGNTYIYSVHHAGGAGTATSGFFGTDVSTFVDMTLRTGSCNATGLELTDVIQTERDDFGEVYFTAGVPVTGYSYEFSQGGSVLAVVDQFAVNGFYLNLGNVNGLVYGQTYQVRVAHTVRTSANNAANTGVEVRDIISEYGSPCDITLGTAPTTNVRAEFCGGTEQYYLAENILAEQLVSATNYLFTFDDGEGTVFTYLSDNYSVQLYQIPEVTYGKIYTVTVQAELVDGFTPVGSACSISMQAKPENASVQAVSCNSVLNWPSSDVILADFILGADLYEFQFTPLDASAPFSVVSPDLSLRLDNNITQFVAGTTYNVAVRVYSNGIAGDYSAACPITIVASGAVIEEGDDMADALTKSISATGVNVFPNPSTGENFFLNMSDLSDDVQKITLTVVDVTGKTVFSEEFANSGSDMFRTVEFRTPLTSGMYFVNIMVNDEVFVEKLTVE